GAEGPEIVAMYPGDRLVDKRLERTSEYRGKAEGGPDALLRDQYPQELSAFTHPPKCDLPFDRIAPILRDHLAHEARFHGAHELDGLRFAIHLRDLESEPW